MSNESIYHYSKKFQQQLIEIHEELPSIEGYDDNFVHQRTLVEFNPKTDRAFMAWFIDEAESLLFLYYPYIGAWQKKFDVTPDQWIGNAIYVGREVEQRNSLPMTEGYGPMTDALTQANNMRH